MKKKIVLIFPKKLVDQPNIYLLVKNYNLIINILRAQITPDEEGKMVIELDGTKKNIENGLKFLRKQAVHLELLAKDIKIDEAKCIDCGACTAVCNSKALSINYETHELEFNRSKCILCGSCVSACPMRIIKITF